MSNIGAIKLTAEQMKLINLFFPKKENYAREHLQLHTIGLEKLNDDGTPVLNALGRRTPNYEQKHIFTSARWVDFIPCSHDNLLLCEK